MNQKELTEKLRTAADEYYTTGTGIMSDHEYDRLLEKLKEMEKESGIIYSGSPTVNVGAKAVESLETKEHEQPALSLDKFKYEEREKLAGFLNGRNAFVAWKMDGLTVVLTYDGGRCVSAVTRGDGKTGSVVTHNARFFEGVPSEIPFKGHLVIRGEAVMSFEEFNRINESMENGYENPRNLAGATVQMLDSSESRKRKICFRAFELVTPAPGDLPGASRPETMTDRMNWVSSQGFDTVGSSSHVAPGDILDEIEVWKEKVKTLPFPTDGLVVTFEDQEYASSLGSTGHHSRGSMALKWTDETKATTLRDVEWSVGKTGVITPVAVFDPVRLGAGSTVKKASLHNVSIMKNIPEMNEGHGHMMIGSKVEVGLANMIIPQVFGFHEGGGSTEEICVPGTCPVCGHTAELRDRNGIQTLHCVNEDCPARQLGMLMNTFSRDALNVKGLGESQIIDLLEVGLADASPASFFRMKEHPAEETAALYDKLMHMDGWGAKKWENLLAAIETARDTTLQKFLYGLNITYLGNDLSKKLAAYWKDSVDEFLKFVDSAAEDPGSALAKLTCIDGVGEGKAGPLVEWAATAKKGTKERKDLEDLIGCLHFDMSGHRRYLDAEEEQPRKIAPLKGMTFVITGSVKRFKNRDHFKRAVEDRGGKVAGSVSKKTDFLVNNDTGSTSGKNKKAAELGIPVISEDEFIERFVVKL